MKKLKFYISLIKIFDNNLNYQELIDEREKIINYLNFTYKDFEIEIIGNNLFNTVFPEYVNNKELYSIGKILENLSYADMLVLPRNWENDYYNTIIKDLFLKFNNNPNPEEYIIDGNVIDFNIINKDFIIENSKKDLNDLKDLLKNEDLNTNVKIRLNELLNNLNENLYRIKNV